MIIRLVVHLLISYSALVKGNCELKPMMYQYYAGYTKLPYEEAKYCCRSKEMSLVSVLNQEELLRLHETLLSESSDDAPVGPLNGFRTSAILKGNWSISNFYWDGTANSINSTLPLSKTFALWGEDLPDNDIGVFYQIENCTTIYLTSPNSFSIEMDDISCNYKLPFICEKSKTIQFEEDPCGDMDFKEFNEGNFLFSSQNFTWRRASRCCSTKNAVLVANPFNEETEKVLKEIIEEINGNSNERFMLWTSGFKVWRNYLRTNDAIIPYYGTKNNSEYCMAVVYKNNHGDLLEYPCENSLPFVCVMEHSQKCSFIDMLPLNVAFAQNKYYYSGYSKVTWRDAYSCCKQKKMQLISIISHEQGSLLSATLDSLSNLPRRHMGFPFGVWTSGRLQSDGKAKFLSLKQSFHVGKQFENNYFLKGPGQCLRFVIDSRNSYVLNNILCKSTRSFICETVEDYQNAHRICNKNGYKLLTITNEDENNSLHLLVQELKKHSGPGSGLWLGASLLNSSNGDARQFIWLSTGENIFYNSFMKYDLDIKSAPENCMVAFSTAEGLFWEDFDCLSQKHFICQYDEDSGCSISSIGENYYLSTKQSKWTDARKCCRKFSAELVSITSQNQNNAISSCIYDVSQNKPFNGIWTSGTNKMVSQNFMWASTGEPVRYSNFLHAFRPGKHLKKNQCIEIFKHWGTHFGSQVVWNLDYCDRKKAFICQKDKGLAPACDEIELSRMKNSKYFYSREKVSWGRAVECCDIQGMDLAEIYESKENDNLFRLLLSYSRKKEHTRHNSGVWIGLSTLMKVSQYSWMVSGKVVNPSQLPYWKGSPEGIIALQKSRAKKKGVKFKYVNGTEIFTGGGCVEAYIDLKSNALKWHDLPCSYRLGFVCQERLAVADKRDFEAPMKLGDYTLEHIGANYFYSVRKESWWNAIKICSQLGTTLLSIEDEEENAVIRTLLVEKSENSLRAYFDNVKVWTSGTDQHKLDSYWWAGIGKKMHYNNIDMENLNSSTRDKMNCISVSLKGTSIHWAKEECAVPLSFICERPEKQACRSTTYRIIDPSKTEGRTVLLTNSAYFISYIRMNWLQASAYCKNHRMELVSIETDMDMKILKQELKNSFYKYYYTSGTNLGAVGTLIFRWSQNGKGVHTAFRIKYNDTLLEVPISKNKISQSEFENSTRISYGQPKVTSISGDITESESEQKETVVVSRNPLCLVFVGGKTKIRMEAVHCSKPLQFVCKTPTECF